MLTPLITLISSSAPAAILQTASVGLIATIEIARRLFSLIQGACLAVFGVVELWFTASSTPSPTLSEKIKTLCCSFFKGLKHCATYPVLHGLLYLGSGIAECAASLQRLDYVHLGIAYPIATACSVGLFVLGNVLSLYYHGRLLVQTLKTIPLSPREETEQFNVRFSAVCAIISNISYIVSCALLCLQGSVIAIIIMTCLGLLGGGVKIVFDFLSSRYVSE